MSQMPPAPLYYVDLTRPYFGETAGDLVAKGWSVLPQTQDRKPGIVDGHSIRPIHGSNLGERLPDRSEMDRWICHCGDHNVAAVMGPGSGGAVAIDLDITERELAKKVLALALGIFGYTPLQRIGNAPKIALLYRQAEQSKPIRTRHIPAEDGGHGIDILGKGGMLTFFGAHHKTGRQFIWPEKVPLQVSPWELPAINQSMIDEFLQRVEEMMPLRTSNINIDRDENAYPDARFTPKYPAPNDERLAVLAWKTHEADPYFADKNQISAAYGMVQRMIVTGWRPELIIHAGQVAFEQNQEESGYKTTVAGTVQNLLTNAHEQTEIARMAKDGMDTSPSGKPQWNTKNWRHREFLAGARQDTYDRYFDTKVAVALGHRRPAANAAAEQAEPSVDQASPPTAPPAYRRPGWAFMPLVRPAPTLPAPTPAAEPAVPEPASDDAIDNPLSALDVEF